MSATAIIAIILLVAIDQLTKYMALIKLKPIGSAVFIEKLINFSFVENTGAAFGIFKGGKWFFIIFTVIAVISVCYFYFSLPKSKEYNFLRVGFILILAGAVGNFIDRLINGYVIDFIEFAFISFPVFNFADICVTVGTAVMMFVMLFCVKD